MKEIIFPKNFEWGTATAAYQIEGAYNKDGKGESIWDRFSNIPGKIYENHNGNIACDHYYKWDDDIKILKELGIKTYRFSISWPRVMPYGKVWVNQKGMDFYKRLINRLLEADIKPVVTLYHWDLPQKLQDIGGWANRDIMYYFNEYCSTMFNSFGDVVKTWITINEPNIIAFLGNYLGTFAPGLTDFSTAFLVAYNLLLSHGKVVNTFRKMNKEGEIGISLSLSPVYPASSLKEDIEASNLYDAFQNRMYLDPLYKGSFPADLLEDLSSKVKLPDIKQKDLELMNSKIDFLGINNYSLSVIKKESGKWPLEFVRVLGDKPQTSMGWEIDPKSLYDLLVRIHEEYKPEKIIITENGAAFDDIIDNGKIDDSNRINYLKEYLIEANKAIEYGVNLKGYYVWSLLDNFEWASGFDKRFGIVHVNYETQERIIKNSGYWYKNTIMNNGFQI